MLYIKSESSSHWYDRNGKPAYEVPNVSKGGGAMRPTTITDARKLGYVPSVTTITKSGASPALERWKQDNLVKAAIELRRRGGSDEFWAKQIVEQANKVSVEAREFGTWVHGAIEYYHKTGKLSTPPFDFDKSVLAAKILAGYIEWSKENVLEVLDLEVAFSSPAGYGGKTDIYYIGTDKEGRYHGIESLDDFKTQKTTPGKKIKSYPEHAMQLAAYHKGRQLGDDCRIRNVIVSSTEPGRIEIVDHTDRLEEHYAAFLRLLEQWKYIRGYDPAFEKEV